MASKPDSDGYAANTFAGKPEQMLKVRDYIAEKGFIPKELIENEVMWFYGYVRSALCLGAYSPCMQKPRHRRHVLFPGKRRRH